MMLMASNPVIYTLGPEGTNCATAAQWWFDSLADNKASGVAPRIVLHETLEQAFDELAEKQDGYLLSCAAYPDLHTLIFTRLGDMELCDSFIMPTHSMVLAARTSPNQIKSVATHPAPQSLVASQYDKIFANSNADAAVLCRAGVADACVTTVVAADRHELDVVQDFGQVPMAFLIHSLKRADNAQG
ncbi:hypothetical protein [Pseudomonas savastanoi]|uniref:YwfB protein n=3 Tax=Pseudomonas savastanoi pv. glycinea TaxID=318 RepID=E7PP29_PSESG|nr:hypothetical protein [Pseudomonas savastanoi]EFW80227.1 hypothetical protein PsgB076_13827 [Pseudomonas savastanoi pv. glycinea str. B076]EFW84706.1 hypothetical protein PsgRace4_17793 [Pseudomonas savastanoi pv. glycinea str. race 4]EGH19680.1 YwfB protein [Pseudomonas savastanoi pv. glycinea str. race 4]MCQ3006010.1 hypothetical protein [Pseudomonas savastanoi]PYD21868.1 hypothetical protein DND36_16980 [Pseudomonas savastanoi pv. glycinea]